MKSLISQKTNEQAHPICIGFDPDISDLHPFLARQHQGTSIATYLGKWYETVADSCGDRAHSIKFQSAFFEQFGAIGFSVLKDMIADAKRRGLFVILDAKRGDISSTMNAYGKTAFDHFGADALTILPWMGTDSLKALIPWMKQGKGIYIVWLSSNASGRHLQITKTADGGSIASKLFQEFYRLAASEGVTAQTGWVLGATDLSTDLINDLVGSPHTFLCPGIGMQGASFDRRAHDLCTKHPSTLFPVSRGILKPDSSDALQTWDDYRQFVGQRWRSLITAWETSR
jgi:orotidine-5'-phosphate decarboxylase